jgi:hypothetical protein
MSVRSVFDDLGKTFLSWNRPDETWRSVDRTYGYDAPPIAVAFVPLLLPGYKIQPMHLLFYAYTGKYIPGYFFKSDFASKLSKGRGGYWPRMNDAMIFFEMFIFTEVRKFGYDHISIFKPYVEYVVG